MTLRNVEEKHHQILSETLRSIEKYLQNIDLNIETSEFSPRKPMLSINCFEMDIKPMKIYGKRLLFNDVMPMHLQHRNCCPLFCLGIYEGIRPDRKYFLVFLLSSLFRIQFKEPKEIKHFF